MRRQLDGPFWAIINKDGNIEKSSDGEYFILDNLKHAEYFSCPSKGEKVEKVHILLVGKKEEKKPANSSRKGKCNANSKKV